MMSACSGLKRGGGVAGNKKETKEMRDSYSFVLEDEKSNRKSV